MTNDEVQKVLIDNYQQERGPFTKEQVEGSVYEKWSGYSSALYALGTGVLNEIDHPSIEELMHCQQRDSMYLLGNQLLEMIGEVNSYPLRNEQGFEQWIITYAYEAIHMKNVELNCRVEHFRKKLEWYLARKVLEQMSKSKKMIEDEREDMKAWRRIRTRRRNKQKKEEEREQDTRNKVKRVQFRSFVVLCNVFKCNRNHNIEQIRAAVDILKSDGLTERVEISAGYCVDCKVFFILEADYKILRGKGILLCQLISKEQYVRKEEGNEGELRAESLLHQCGYNVREADNLSAMQRREILKRVIDNGLYSISGLLSFLDWLIDRNKRSTKRDMSAAIEKWSEDRDFIANYESNAQKKVRVKTIRR